MRIVMKKVLKYGCLSIIIIFVLLFLFIIYMLNKSFEVINSADSAVVELRSAVDLSRVSGISFPDVIVCDSLYHYDLDESYNMTKYILKDKETMKVLRSRAKNACKKDSNFWAKTDRAFIYHIYADKDIDRSHQNHGRLVESGDGNMIEDWDGSYIHLEIPVTNDTIILKIGWAR